MIRANILQIGVSCNVSSAKKNPQKSFKMKNVHVLHLFTSFKYLVFLPDTFLVGNELVR